MTNDFNSHLSNFFCQLSYSILPLDRFWFELTSRWVWRDWFRLRSKHDLYVIVWSISVCICSNSHVPWFLMKPYYHLPAPSSSAHANQMEDNSRHASSELNQPDDNGNTPSVTLDLNQPIMVDDNYNGEYISISTTYYFALLASWFCTHLVLPPYWTCCC